ncbi:MAG: class I SAM-dependent methyltransferase [Gemmatimonadaceae bacterium]|nr:class I SAM-dependent methyltransferase [Gemmatimonadaceae bacterium]
MSAGSAHFAHLFSGHASTYAAFRPRYPDALYEWLLSHTPQREQAWDVGTGNGQVALALAEHFAQVMATDPSAEQLAAAPAHPRVQYRVATYDSALAPASAGLVTVGQALHWFDLPQFFAEVKRVLVPGGLFAAFAYVHSGVDAKLDQVTRHYHDVTCDAYWAPEHHLIRNAYRTLALPIAEIPAPEMFVEATMTLAQYAGFFRSWSATQRLLRAEGEAPVLAFERALAEAWGEDVPRLVRWPLIVRAGRLV